jgi:hypothetical protein
LESFALVCTQETGSVGVYVLTVDVELSAFLQLRTDLIFSLRYLSTFDLLFAGIFKKRER